MKTSILSLAALLAAAPLAAHAHTQLSESAPADEAVLDAAPREIVLSFSEGVRLTAVSIEGPGSAQTKLGPLPGEMKTRFTMKAPELAAGDYVVSWRALSADTHVISGEIGFTVAGDARTPQ